MMLQRACALTQGYVLDCRDSVGGVKEVYIAELASVESITVASGAVSALVNDSAKQFYRYAQVKQTSEADEQIQTSEENGTVYVEQNVKLVLNKLQTAVRNEIMLLAQNRLIVVVVDRNNQGWLYGAYNGMTLQPSSAKTGVAMGDRNGYELSLKGMESALAFSVPSAIVDALTTPGA